MIATNGDDPETGSGPCAACHMADSAGHTFEAVERDSAGNIAAIKNQALCNDCHGSSMSPAVLVDLKGQFEDARSLLQDYVDNSLTNYLDLDVADNYEDVGLNDYGSFQNSIYMREEPCIYLHNSNYGRRLVFDTIDWLDNGVLNGTISIPAEYPGARTWLNANSNGVATRP